MKIALSIVFLLTSYISFAQCNVSVKNYSETNVTIYVFKPEKLGEAGLMNPNWAEYDISFQIEDYHDKKMSLILAVGINSIGTDTPIFPRKITLYSDKNDSHSITSFKYKPIVEDRTAKSYAYWFFFEIDPDAYTFIANNLIPKVEIYDERLDKGVIFDPFNKLFRNQMNCVWKEYGTK